MKKHIIAMLLVVAMCLPVLYGCNALGGLEKDVEVTVMTDGQTWGTYTVNAFNNAVVPVPDPPQGKVFYGWTADSDWQNKDAASIAVTANKGLIRYDDVKDGAKDGKITLYAVFTDAPKRDLVVAWYDKETTSGLNQAVMDTFTTELNAYLTEQGKTPADMDIDVRGYQGDVGTTCSEIKNDGDVDIMIGWSGKSNLNDKGGWVAGTDFLASYGKITLTNATKARYAQRITDTELCNLVYAWILATYAGEGGATKDYDIADENKPEPDPNPDENKYDLVIAWYNNDKSGLTAEIMETFKTDLTAYLAEQNKSDVKVGIRAYEGTVKPSCDAIKTDGDVNIMLGWGKTSNLVKTGLWTAGTDFLELYFNVKLTGVTVADRSAVRITDTELTKLVYAWIIQTYGAEATKEYPAEETPAPDPNPDPNPDEPEPITETNLKVSVWNKNFTWISEEQLNNLKKDFNDYLVTLGVDVSKLSITWVIETATGVADLGTSVKDAGDVDFIVGCGVNVESTGGLTNLTKKQVMASPYMAVERYVALLHKDNPNQLAKALYEFMTGEDYPANA